VCVRVTLSTPCGGRGFVSRRWSTSVVGRGALPVSRHTEHAVWGVGPVVQTLEHSLRWIFR